MQARSLILMSSLLVLGWVAGAQTTQAPATTQPARGGVPDDARYACPMETHPDETDPARQGAYFSADDGNCPWCGMTLKPVDELAWVHTRRAAAGAEVAYTCPDHQHVFAKSRGDCPRCGRTLEPFKVLYTCPDPRHADVIRLEPGHCPHCRWKLTPFRGIWLSPQMADRNLPPNPQAASDAPYRCPIHPLAHGSRPGRCPICAGEMVPAQAQAESRPTEPAIPPDAKFVCPMEECWAFATEPGTCPTCGMRLKPIDAVDWAQARIAAGAAAQSAAAFVCPMHPDQTAAAQGTCPTCGMLLVPAAAVPKPASAPSAIAANVTYLMEHYLALHQRFASDSTRDVALHALGLVGAADEILKHLDDPDARLPADFAEAVRALRAGALKTNGRDLDADRVTFVSLGTAMKRIIEHIRPSTQQYPKLYLFHCPMTKGDWIQSSEQIANPFYGFAMLGCGERTGVR